jgi:Putative metallopeptidase
MPHVTQLKRATWFRRAAAAAVLAAASVSISSMPAMAQAELRNDKIKFDYYEPRDPKLLPLYERLQRRRVLEELSQFLAPVRWPKTLRLIMKECPAGTQRPEVIYSSVERSISICYQLLAFLGSLQPQPAFATQQEVIVGGLVGAVLHESARAIFDMLNIPRLGDDGDAADQLAAFIGLQFGEEVARVVVKGSYFVWKRYDDEIAAAERQYDFSARSSVPRQRMYNTLCIAYGGSPTTFKAFVDQGDLLSSRAENCADEYRRVQHAFQKTIVPHIDAVMMAKARSTKWISPDDFK